METLIEKWNQEERQKEAEMDQLISMIMNSNIQREDIEVKRKKVAQDEKFKTRELELKEKDLIQSLMADQMKAQTETERKKDDKRDKLYSRNEDKAEKIYSDYLGKAQDMRKILNAYESIEILAKESKGSGIAGAQVLKGLERLQEQLAGGRVSTVQQAEFKMSLDFAKGKVDSLVDYIKSINSPKRIMSPEALDELIGQFKKPVLSLAKDFDTVIASDYKAEFNKLKPHRQDAETYEWEKWEPNFKIHEKISAEQPREEDNGSTHAEKEMLDQMVSPENPIKKEEVSFVKKMQDAMYGGKVPKEQLESINRGVEDADNSVNEWKLFGDSKPKENKGWEDYMLNTYGAITDPTNLLMGPVGGNLAKLAPKLLKTQTTKNMAVGGAFGAAHDIAQTGEVGGGAVIGAAIPAALKGVGKGVQSVLNKPGAQEIRIANALGGEANIKPGERASTSIQEILEANKGDSSKLYNEALQGKLKLNGTPEEISSKAAMFGGEGSNPLRQVQDKISELKHIQRQLSKQKGNDTLHYKEYEQQMSMIRKEITELETILDQSLTNPELLSAAHTNFKENVLPLNKIKKYKEGWNMGVGNTSEESTLGQEILKNTKGYGGQAMKLLPQETKNNIALESLIGKGKTYHPNSSSIGERAAALPSFAKENLTPETAKLIEKYVGTSKDKGPFLGGVLNRVPGTTSIDKLLNRVLGRYKGNPRILDYLSKTSPYLGSRGAAAYDNE
jgi:hypothetical protein